MPVLPEAENGTLTDNDRVRRVRGRELADVLCGLAGGGARAAPPAAGTRTVRLLCSVFDLAGRRVRGCAVLCVCLRAFARVRACVRARARACVLPGPRRRCEGGTRARASESARARARERERARERASESARARAREGARDSARARRLALRVRSVQRESPSHPPLPPSCDAGGVLFGYTGSVRLWGCGGACGGGWWGLLKAAPATSPAGNRVPANVCVCVSFCVSVCACERARALVRV